MQAVVLKVKTHHLKEVYVGRCCTYEAVYHGVALQQGVDKQRVGCRDIAVYAVIVYTITIGIVVIVVGCAHLVVEHPCRLVVSLDCRLHKQCASQHVVQSAIQTLKICVGVRQTHIVLI